MMNLRSATRLLTLAFALFGATALAACSNPDNGAACEAYVMQINELDCFTGVARLDPAVACAGVNDFSCDVSAFYDCLTANTSCMDLGGMSLPDTSGTAMCAGLATCE